MSAKPFCGVRDVDGNHVLLGNQRHEHRPVRPDQAGQRKNYTDSSGSQARVPRSDADAETARDQISHNVRVCHHPCFRRVVRHDGIHECQLHPHGTQAACKSGQGLMKVRLVIAARKWLQMDGRKHHERNRQERVALVHQIWLVKPGRIQC